jgi:hypothetical protein
MGILDEASGAVSGNNSSTAGSSFDKGLNSVYQVNTTNWYKTLPYGFVFFNRNVNDKDPEVNAPDSKIFYLPISPSNIRVTTNFATNAVTTLYGVVEEHSPIKWFDISITGTTGISPRYYNEKSSKQTKDDSFKSTGRSAFDSSPFFDLGGFLPEITNMVNQVKNVASSIGEEPTYDTGVSADKSGYAAFHNFYRYLVKYKNDAAGVGHLGNSQRKSTKLLQFLNYKDGIKYDCIPLTFELTRSANDPMMYNYSINMRCYNLVSINNIDQDVTPGSKFRLVEDQDRLNDTSAFAKLADVTSSVGTLVSGFI